MDAFYLPPPPSDTPVELNAPWTAPMLAVSASDASAEGGAQPSTWEAMLRGWSLRMATSPDRALVIPAAQRWLVKG